MNVSFEIERILYQFFLVADNYVLRYDKIRGILQYLGQNKFEGHNVDNAFYNLKKWGVIETSDRNFYRLSHPLILHGGDFAVGINLDERSQSKLSVLNTDYRGVGIIVVDNSQNLTRLGLNICTHHFDSQKLLRQIPKIGRLVHYNCLEPYEIDKSLSNIQYYKPKEGIWRDITFSEIKDKNSVLLKVFKFNSNSFFDYLFKYKGRFYRFKLHDIEQINLFKTYLRLKEKVLFFGIENGKFLLQQKTPFPTIIEKIMAISHMLLSGHISANRCYRLDETSIKRLTQILTL